MDIGRMVANAAVRKFVYLVVALLFGLALNFCGVSQAHAQDQAPCTVATPCSQQTAYSLALEHANSGALCPSTYPIIQGPNSVIVADANRYRARSTCYRSDWNQTSVYVSSITWFHAGCPAGSVWDPTMTMCVRNCVGIPSITVTPNYRIPNGAVGCFDGCATTLFSNSDGTYRGESILGEACNVIPDCTALGLNTLGYVFNVSYGTCEPPVVECEANQTKGPGGTCVDACPAGMHQDTGGVCKPDKEECPPGNIKSPEGTCLPGEGQCAAGEAKKKDGTCGKDADGDGEADDDDEDPENDTDKDAFSGGDNCNSPPSCSGSPIMCGQARIQWRIDCNTRKNVNISGGACAAEPICTGEKCNAMEYSQLLMQWRTACALEGLDSGGPGGGGGNDDIIDLLTGPGSISDTSGPGGSEDLGPGYDDEGEEIEPDTSGFGWSSSCPATPSFDVFGHTFTFDPDGIVCDWVGVGGYFVMLLAGLMCLRIINGATV